MTSTPGNATRNPTVASPDQLGAAFMERYAAGDMDALAELYTDDAIFVTAPGEQAKGRDAIRAAMAAMHEAGATINLELRRIHVVDDIALFSNVATVTGAMPDGGDATLTTCEVAVRGGDDGWRYVVDDPFWLV